MTMDTFLTKFEEILEELDNTGELPSARFQKILLLSRINDDRYDAVKTQLKLDNSNYF